MTSTTITIAGRPITAPLKTLCNYAAKYGGTLRQYDFAPKGEPTVLTGAEIWTTRIIHSRVTHAERDELEKASASWESHWAAISPDAVINDADPAVEGGLYDSMLKLYTLMTRIPGVSTAKASKILHFKRPDLYPILDSRLVELYRDSAAVAAQRHPERGFKRMYWAAIRNDVVANQAALSSLRHDLRNQSDDIDRLTKLSDLRLLDILSWSE